MISMKLLVLCPEGIDPIAQGSELSEANLATLCRVDTKKLTLEGLDTFQTITIPKDTAHYSQFDTFSNVQ